MRVCSGAGCLCKIEDGARFCEDCKPARSNADGIKAHTSGYDAELDALRKSARWQRIAHSVIRSQPLCARCDRISELCDHIVPAKEAIAQTKASGRYPFSKHAGYFLRSNLQGLCRKCHGVKTLEDKAHIGPWPDVVAIEAAAPKRAFAF